MRKTIMMLALAFCIQAGFSQQKQRLQFHSLQQVGLINGNGAVSGLLQSVNGLEKHNWFAGAGIGLDFYRYRTVPLFIDIKKYISIKNGNRFFIYADGGYNIPWLPKKEENFTWGSGQTKAWSEYKGGLYFDAGLGYAIKFRSGNNMLLSTGYSYKYFEETKTTKTTVVGTAGTTESVDKQYYDFTFKRLMIKIGWEF
ncbi:hypothetical protein DC498_13365 [Terrimonas sp.]|uniref:hypothetical protein n=1 Tax=Terrimonas sp. TaxID=1914338 RepID=UPI000D50FFA6|nr:hypothetical protein [Terrimonas sp.]PVD51705.1 hypothetical protein DC498_13365 [Terrimonas sp.]